MEVALGARFWGWARWVVASGAVRSLEILAIMTETTYAALRRMWVMVMPTREGAMDR
jgi:hypothetical protein